jgi:hypothetical protein
MRAVVLIVLTACAASRARVAPKVDPASSQRPVEAESKTAKTTSEAAPQTTGRSCAELLKLERSVAENVQLALAHDREVLVALGQCERFLFDRGGQKVRQALADSQALYVLTPEALAGLPDDEVYSYIALLNRFALIGDLRRQLYYAPRLRPWFERMADQKVCTDAVREAWLYFSSTPESLGGSASLGAALAARCP